MTTQTLGTETEKYTQPKQTSVVFESNIVACNMIDSGSSVLGRSYLLDVSRVTPRDANWVRGAKGTGGYNEWMAVSASRGSLDAARTGDVAHHLIVALPGVGTADCFVLLERECCAAWSWERRSSSMRNVC